jgi:hypothetical protein
MRIYNEQLVCVYSEEDLENSEIIGKIKGRDVLGFSIREQDDFLHYEIEKIDAKALQLIIRNRENVTIALKMSEDEIIDYFYEIVYKLCSENAPSCCDEENIDECINQEIDSGIAKSEVFYAVRSKVLDKLKLNFTIIQS